MGFSQLLLRIYLAHMLADFPLQFDKIFAWKIRYKYLGVIPHILIHFFVMLLMVFPFLNKPAVFFALVVICVVHYFIDIGKIELNKYLYLKKQNPYKELFYFFFDQFVHLLTIVFAGFLFFSRSISLEPWFSLPAWFNSFYMPDADSLVMKLIFITFAMYGTPVIAFTLSRMFFDQSAVVFKARFREEFFSKLYRFLIVVILLLPGNYPYLVIFPFLIVMIYYYTKRHLSSYNYFKEMIATLCTIILGVILRVIV